MTRKITLTYELPEELVEVLEQKAGRNGRSFEDELLGYLASQLPRPRELSPEEIKRHREALERYFGCWDSGDPNSSDNERIDEDLAREYGDDHEGEGN